MKLLKSSSRSIMGYRVYRWPKIGLEWEEGSELNEGGILVDSTFNGGVQEKNISAGMGYAHFD